MITFLRYLTILSAFPIQQSPCLSSLCIITTFTSFTCLLYPPLISGIFNAPFPPNAFRKRRDPALLEAGGFCKALSYPRVPICHFVVSLCCSSRANIRRRGLRRTRWRSWGDSGSMCYLNQLFHRSYFRILRRSSYLGCRVTFLASPSILVPARSGCPGSVCSGGHEWLLSYLDEWGRHPSIVAGWPLHLTLNFTSHCWEVQLRCPGLNVAEELLFWR